MEKLLVFSSRFRETDYPTLTHALCVAGFFSSSAQDAVI